MTAKKFLTTKKYLEEFLREEQNKTDIALRDLKSEFMTNFKVFLLTNKNMRNNSMVNHLKRLRSIMRFSVENEYMPSNPFASHKFKMKKVERTHLEQSELNTIENKNFDIPRLEMMRDLFLFSCYTGIAYIDAQNLKQEDILLGIDNEKWIIRQREKTNMKSEVQLLPQAVAILEKYKNIH